MAEKSEVGGRRENGMTLSVDACKNDDVSLMERALATASQPGSHHSVQDVSQRSMKRAASRQSLQVLQYLLDQGTEVSELSPSDLLPQDDPRRPSPKTIEVLLEHGWDINTTGPSSKDRPLLWQIVAYHGLVLWCLDHGARVNVSEPPPHISADGSRSYSHVPWPTILGAAAAFGTVETFELLKKHDAPIDRRTLHLAVEHAALLAPREGDDRSEAYERRIDMVRHLLDRAKLDVNAIEHQLGSQCSTPLCCVAKRRTSQDFRQIVSLLLDHGAQLDLANEDGHLMTPMACAQSCGNTQFLRAVDEWQANIGDGIHQPA